jgi:hypothetical protein
VALTRWDRDRVLVNSHIWERWSANRPVRRLHLEDVASIDAEPLRRLGVQLDPRAPRDLRDRVGELLEPRLVGTAPVAENRRLVRDEEEIALCAADRR